MDKKYLKKIPIKEYIHSNLSLSGAGSLYMVHAYKHEDILVLDIYRNMSELKFRIFHTLTDYIVLEDNRWRVSGLTRLFYWWQRTGLFTDKESTRIMQEYLNTDKDPLDKLVELQEEIKWKRLSIAHQKEKDEIDAFMKHVKQIPKGFYKWVEDEVMKESRYIVYEYSKGSVMHGKCTYCKNDVLVNQKHNTIGKCPSCKSIVTFKAKGKFSQKTDRGIAKLVQSYPGGAIVREFEVSYTHKNYSDTGLTTEMNHFEVQRKIVSGNIKSFHFGNFKNTDEYRWCNGLSYNMVDCSIYPQNITREMKNTKYKYSALKEMINSGASFSPENYLNVYENGPALEYLVKLGLTKIVQNIGQISVSYYKLPTDLKIDLNAKNPQGVLSIGKRNLKLAIKHNADYNLLALMQHSEAEGLHLSEEDLLYIAKKYHGQHADFVKIAKLSNVYQLLKYTENINLRDYRDYIQMAEELGWNTRDRFVLFPRNFQEAHDQAVELTDIKQAEKHNKVIAEFYKKNSKSFNFSHFDLTIRLPQNAEEVLKEGKTLHHCVGTYIKHIADGKRLVLFIRDRKHPERPLYTMELDPGTLKLIQVRGNKNRDMRQALVEMLAKYQEHLKKKIKSSITTAA